MERSSSATLSTTGTGEDVRCLGCGDPSTPRHSWHRTVEKEADLLLGWTLVRYVLASKSDCTIS
jgi:hypothetical protein